MKRMCFIFSCLVHILMLSSLFSFWLPDGPDAVTIFGPDEFDINPSQVQNISLSCLESIVSPFVNYSWTGCPSGDSMSHICSARPSPSDTSYFVQCTVSNPLSHVTRTANHSVELNCKLVNAYIMHKLLLF